MGIVASNGVLAKSPGDLGADLWLRTDLGVTLVSGRVSVFANQGSGTNLDHSQGIATRRALFIASDPDFNGRASIDKMDTSAEESLSTTVASASLNVPDGGDLSALVIGSTAEDPSNFILYRSLAWPGNGFELVIGTGAGGMCSFNLRDVEGVGTIDPSINANPALDQAIALFGEYTGAISPALDSGVVAVDGTTDPAITGDLQTVQASGTFRIFVGARDGNLGEIGIWTRLLTVGEKASVAVYVEGLWAIPIDGGIG